MADTVTIAIKIHLPEGSLQSLDHKKFMEVLSDSLHDTLLENHSSVGIEHAQTDIQISQKFEVFSQLGGICTDSRYTQDKTLTVHYEVPMLAKS